MKNLKEIDQTLLKELQNIADKSSALLMSFIAPEKIVRTSPVSYDYARITVTDLYNMEKEIENLKQNNRLPKNLHLIIQTPGGDVYAATRIVKYLLSTFEHIEAFVPYEAASGGTMLCLTANTITMDSASYLTPIDPQVRYKGQYVSATTFEQAVSDFQEDFGKYRPEEIPSPYQQMGEQFDPVILKEMKKIVFDTFIVAYETLKVSQKAKNKDDQNKILNLTFALGKTAYPHSHVIAIDEARRIGLNIDNSQEKITLLKTYKRWVSCRLKEESTSHVIDVICPTIKNSEQKKNGKDKKETY